MELTVSVEKALTPAPVPGTALLMEDTVMVDRTRPLAIILDITMVEPLNVDPIRVETVIVDPFKVDRTSLFAVILDAAIVEPLNVEPDSVETVMVLPSMVE